MTRLAGLAFVASGLAGLIAFEIHAGPSADVATVQRMPVKVLRVPAKEAGGRIQEWVGAVSARPPFSPDRRAAADARTIAGAALPGLPRLSGILVGLSERSAIFAGEHSKSIVVREGEHVSAYWVQMIQPGAVQLVGPDGSVVLSPKFAQRVDNPAGSTASPLRYGGTVLPQ